MNKKLIQQFANMQSIFSMPGDNLNLWKIYLKKINCKSIPQNLWIGEGTKIENNGVLEFNENLSLGYSCSVINWGTITIGESFLGSNFISINSGDHDKNTLMPKKTKIEIGKRVFCGTNVTIIGNTKIGNDCVIAAGSVVKGDFPHKSLIYGNPAKSKLIPHRKSNIWEWHKKHNEKKS